MLNTSISDNKNISQDDYNYLFDKRFIINYKNLLSKKYSYTNI